MVFLEDVLAENEITNNLRYFTNYWEYFCKTVEQPSVYTTIMTPNYLVKEIIDELQTNGINNTSTLKYFYEQNTSFLKERILFDTDSYSLWILLNEKLTEKDKKITVLKSIAEKLDSKFKSIEYKNFIFENLKQTIKAKEERFGSIRVITETIIFQFIFENYSIDYIKKMIRNIFSFYSYDDYGNGEKRFFTNYPLKTKMENNNYEDYVKKASSEIENLTLDSRLTRLYEVLINEPNTYYFIFYLKGLYFDKSITYGDITFYNPKKEPVLKSENEFENDTFSHANYDIGMNAIVLQKGKDIKIAKLEAIKKIQIICDIFKLYNNAKAKLQIDDSSYRVLFDDKTICSWAMGNNKNKVGPYDIIREPDTIQNVNDVFEKIYLSEKITQNDKSILFDSLHFFRKAIESDSQEEILLNFWISLERLFLDFDTFSSKFERTCTFVQAILIERFIFLNGWNCYNLIDNLLKSKTGHRTGFVQEIDFPKELQIKANIGEYLTYPITIELKKFIDCIPEIKNYSKNLVANDVMQNIYDFYKNHKTAENEITTKIEEIKSILLMIYRQRNQIVHNARYDKTLIEYNIAQIKSIVTMVLVDLLKSLEKGTSLKDVIMDYYIKYEQDFYLATKDPNYCFIEKL